MNFDINHINLNSPLTAYLRSGGYLETDLSGREALYHGLSTEQAIAALRRVVLATQHRNTEVTHHADYRGKVCFTATSTTTGKAKGRYSLGPESRHLAESLLSVEIGPTPASLQRLTSSQFERRIKANMHAGGREAVIPELSHESCGRYWEFHTERAAHLYKGFEHILFVLDNFGEYGWLGDTGSLHENYAELDYNESKNTFDLTLHVSYEGEQVRFYSFYLGVGGPLEPTVRKVMSSKPKSDRGLWDELHGFVRQHKIECLLTGE